MLQGNFITVTFQDGCSLNLVHIFRKPFYRNNSRGLLLSISGFSFVTVDVFCEISEIFRTALKKKKYNLGHLCQSPEATIIAYSDSMGIGRAIFWFGRGGWAHVSVIPVLQQVLVWQLRIVMSTCKRKY